MSSCGTREGPGRFKSYAPVRRHHSDIDKRHCSAEGLKFKGSKNIGVRRDGRVGYGGAGFQPRAIVTMWVVICSSRCTELDAGVLRSGGRCSCGGRM